MVQALDELVLRLGEVAQARHVDGDHADRTGLGVRAEETAAALVQLALVQPQPAAHRTGVIRAHVGVDEVREVRDAVFRGHFPQFLQAGAFPVEILRDVVGRDREGEDTALRVALGHHFEEGVVDHVHLFLELTVGLVHQLAADDRGLVRQRGGRVKIHRQVGERGLESHAGRDVHVEDEFLKGLLYLFIREVVVMDEGGQKGVETGERLRAGRLTLKGIEEVDDLAERGPEVFRGIALRLAGNALKAVHQQVLEVPAHAVDAQQTQVMQMDRARIVGGTDLIRVDLVEPVGLADLAGDEVVEPLEGVRHVRILVHAPVGPRQIAVDQVHAGFLDHVADTRVLVTVDDVGLGGPAVGGGEQHLFDDILHRLDRHVHRIFQRVDQRHYLDGQLLRTLQIILARRGTCPLKRGNDLFRVKCLDSPVAFTDFKHQVRLNQLSHNPFFPRFLQNALRRKNNSL